jgi:tetratricopeptide (TPR) repeat protein
MLDAREEVAAHITRLEAHERAQVVRVDPLAEQDHAELIRRTLRLDAALSRQVKERTAGNPLFAVQLIGDWVSRGILEVGRDGFSLRQGAASTLPRDIHDLWIQRVDKLLDDFEPERRHDLRVALELAAMLGRYVDEAEWREVCRQQGVEASEDLARRMVEQGLVRRERSGASFVHSMLAESLREAAQRVGRAEEHHLACVRAIEALHPKSPLETARRRALHLIGAGRLHEALDPLKDAVHYCNDRGDYRASLTLLEKREELADRLGLGDEDRCRVENLWVRAQMEIPLGDSAASLAHAERAAEIAERHGWHVDLGHALVVQARVLRDRAEYDEALAVLDRAGEELARVDDAIGLLFVCFAKGFIHMRRGKLAVARSFFDEALAYARELEDQPRVAEILSQVGYSWFAENNYERARQVLADALQVAERLGSLVSISSCSRHLGEIARFEGNWDEAREHYERAMGIERSREARNEHLDRLNLVLVAIATGRFAHSYAELLELRQIFEQRDMHFALPIIEVALVASAAGLGDADAFDAAWQRASKLVDNLSATDKDIGWLANRAADACERAGWPHRADQMRRLAQAHHVEGG